MSHGMHVITGSVLAALQRSAQEEPDAGQEDFTEDTETRTHARTHFIVAMPAMHKYNLLTRKLLQKLQY